MPHLQSFKWSYLKRVKKTLQEKNKVMNFFPLEIKGNLQNTSSLVQLPFLMENWLRRINKHIFFYEI